MILVTRLHGSALALNSDLIERAESTPDTVLTLVDGTKYVVRESIEDVVDRIREFRASVVALANRLDGAPHDQAATLRLVPARGPAEEV